MKLTLIDYPRKPIETLYTAYRVCYSKKPVTDIIQDVESGKITHDEIKTFLRRMFKTGHTSPLRQLHFVFVMEDVSRVLTAQFNRHVIGIDRCEMSQRYTHILNNPCVYPAMNDEQDELFENVAATCFEDYQNLINMGMLREDARYILPMGTESREQFSMSLDAMRHFLDVRLCESAQTEIRNVAWKMYKIMRKRFPFLSSCLGVKCWENRIGYCDENEGRHAKCKWSRTRPHKNELIKLWKRRR